MTLDALRRYVRLWDLECAEFEHTGTVLFCWPDGRPIHPETISDWFARHSNAAELPLIRLHDVRHSYATAAQMSRVASYASFDKIRESSHCDVVFRTGSRPAGRDLVTHILTRR